MILSLAGAARDAGVILHAAAVVRNGRGYLFLARSGGGKSTLCAMCDREGVEVLGDDLVLVLENATGFFLRPMPRQVNLPSAALPVGASTRVSGVFFLEKAEEPRLESMSPLKAVSRCVSDRHIVGFKFMAPDLRSALLGRCMRFFRSTPSRILHFAKDSRFWRLVDDTDRVRPDPALS